MFFRRKSALLVDFDNLTAARLADHVPGWVAWLERGGFETDRKRPRKRRFVTKRVYWYGAHDRIREPFENAGFDAYPCRSPVDGKNPTDMMIALDAIDVHVAFKGLKEVILLSRDSDFIPVVSRLKEKGLEVIVAADRNDPSAVIYRQLADRLIYIDMLAKEAALPSGTAPVAQPRPARSRQPRQSGATEPGGRSQAHAKLLDSAAGILADAAAQLPGPMGRKAVVAILSKNVKGFSISGQRAWLGCGDYRPMLEELVSRNPRLRLREYESGGAAIQYQPPEQPG